MRWPTGAVLVAGVVTALSLVAGEAPAVAATALPGTITTRTTITSSATSITRNAWVRFTVTVSAAKSIPAGSVTFTDISNGSILGTANLHHGTATFVTAALAPGAREIQAHYPGYGSFGRSTSPALTVSVKPSGSFATAFQVNPRHDGNQSSGTLTAAGLTKKWTVTLGGNGYFGPAAVSYPVIAGGQVFVTVENSLRYGTKLYALSARTGAKQWSVGLGGMYNFSALTYDGRRIFALNYSGTLTAFAASTGHVVWSVRIPSIFTAPPTAFDGVIYLSGWGDVYAISENDGSVLWRNHVEYGDDSSPAVDNTGAYVSYACQQDYRFKLDGHLAWHHATDCAGGGGRTAVLHGKSVYALGEGWYWPPVILSKASGTTVGSFASIAQPAFGGKNMYMLRYEKLIAADLSGKPRWRFAKATLATAPVVTGRLVFVGGSDGAVYGVSASTGRRLWAGKAGSIIYSPEEQNVDVRVGMAIGGGLLVVPAGNQVTAFGD